MTWQRGDGADRDRADRDREEPQLDRYGDEIDPPEPIPPWRAAAPVTPGVAPRSILVEAYDDELPVPSKADEVREAAARARVGFGPATRHVLQLVAFALAVIGALAGIAVGAMHIVGDPLADAHAYYEAASRLNAGEPLYPASLDPNGNHIYLYPPLLAVAMRPFALLPFEAFAVLWELAVVGSFVLLLRYLGVRKRSTWLAIGMAGVPIAWALTVAQAHVPFTYLLALGQPWSIALAANLKLTPVLIAIWWLGRRDWESFFAFLVWMALFALLQVGLEWNGSVSFFQSIGFDEVGQVRNISPYAQSPLVWIALVIVGALVTLALARTRWGWAAAVTLVTLSPPRLLVYMLMGLLAGLRQPKIAGEPDPDDLSDPARVYGAAAR